VAGTVDFADFANHGEHVEIDWEAARQANWLNWEERVPIHEKGYGTETHDDADYRPPHIRSDLVAMAPYLPSGSLSGLRVCHLQCHIGTDTLALAREGAQVTGLDFSPSALASAANFALKYGADITWVESDVMDARAAITGDFDVVYTSVGTICWLSDLERWANQIALLLRPGGLFYFFDSHPILGTIDETADELVSRYRYFPDGTAQSWDDDSTYAGSGKVSNSRTYEFPHSVSEIVNALIGAGLTILQLDEGKVLPWEFSPRMERHPDGWSWPGKEPEQSPVTLTVIARKPVGADAKES
jgi:SAM-dependent methyltransferase